MRVVIDTNVLISAFLRSDSIPSKVFFELLAKHTVLTSNETLEEFQQKIPNRKFDRYVDLPTRLAFAIALERKAEQVAITHKVSSCRDVKDNKFLELALSGSADCIISGDPDLLTLNPFEGIPILSPNEFFVQHVTHLD